MMKIPSFFKDPKYKRFEYKPRYYSEEQEKREERQKEIEHINQAVADGTYRQKIDFRKHAREKWQRSLSTEKRKSNNRLAVILGVLVFIVYLAVKGWV